MGQFDQAPFPMTHEDVEDLIEAIQPTNIYVDLPVSIPTSGWSNSSPYVYTYTNSKITAECGIEVDFLANSENADVMYLEYEKVAGGVQFTAPKKPTVAIPVNIRVINADAEAFNSISADMVSTDAISGASNVQQALSMLNSKISVEPTVSSYNANIGTNSINARKVGKMVMVSGYFTLTGSVSTSDNLFNVSGIDLANYGFVAKSGGGFATIYTDANGNIKANENMPADMYYINDVFATANL